MNRSRKGGKSAVVTANPLSPPPPPPIGKDKDNTKLDELLNKYKDKPSLKSLNNYAKFLSLGFTSFIKNGKITLLEQYGYFLQKDGAIII